MNNKFGDNHLKKKETRLEKTEHNLPLKISRWVREIVRNNGQLV